MFRATTVNRTKKEKEKEIRKRGNKKKVIDVCL